MRKNTVALIVMLIVTVMTQVRCGKSGHSSTKEIEIGGLFSLTGNWSSLGINSKAAIELASEDVNSYLKSIGSDYRVTTRVFDTRLDTALALRFLKEADSQGIRFIIGPQSSAEVAAVKAYTDANDMMIISQGSTAGSLALNDDNIFRFCPSDALEGVAIARTIHNSGKRALVTLARDDAGNKGLQQSVTAAFIVLGGTVVTIPPYSVNSTDFTALAAAAKTQADLLIDAKGAEAVGVYLASFDECVPLFKAAAAHQSLSGLQWYGGDGVVLSTALTADSLAASFALSTRFFAPTFGLPEQARSKWEPLSARINAKTGTIPDAFALAAYDAVWVLALSISNMSDYSQSNFDNVKLNFMQLASSYYGATGPTLLNTAGDRKIGSFDYWGITKQTAGFSWQFVGKSE